MQNRDVVARPFLIATPNNFTTFMLINKEWLRYENQTNTVDTSHRVEP